jgi:hypothetical protein
MTGQLSIVCRENSSVFIKFDMQQSKKSFLKYSYFVIIEVPQYENAVTTNEHVFMVSDNILQ